RGQISMKPWPTGTNLKVEYVYMAIPGSRIDGQVRHMLEVRIRPTSEAAVRRRSRRRSVFGGQIDIAVVPWAGAEEIVEFVGVMIGGKVDDVLVVAISPARDGTALQCWRSTYNVSSQVVEAPDATGTYR